MGFAQEIRDFTSAFTAVSSALGTRSSREGQRLDNEYRRATIDWTKARTAEMVGQKMELPNFLAGAVGGMKKFDLTPPVADTPTGKPSTAVVLTGAGMGGMGGKPATPPAHPISAPPTPLHKISALDTTDSDLLNSTADVNSMMGGTGRDELARSYKVGIIDHTTWDKLQPRALKIADTMGLTARQMGIELVATAGAGGGHKSHGSGTETDWMGYKVDANGKRLREWNPSERAKIAAAGGSAGADRFGLYPGGSLHVGISSRDANVYRPSAMWGAGGVLKGPSARNFSNPADRQFLAMFQSGKLYGSSSDDHIFGSDGSDGFPAYRGGDTMDMARNAIAAVESTGSGGYSAVNRRSGALGRYQVMPQYLSQWSRGALGRSVGRDEFLANPKIQDAVFDYHFGELLSKHGNLNDAASAWFTGRPLGGGGAGADDGNIDGQEYVRRFNAALGRTMGAESGGGSAMYGGVSAPAAMARSDGGDDLIAPYPESRTKDDAAGPSDEANPMASSTDDTTLKSTYGDRDIVHEVQPGDTLWDLSKRYNLESYLKIVEANPQIADPDKIYPKQNLVIPGGQQDAPGVPNPPMRPGAVDTGERAEGWNIPLPGVPAEGDPTVPLPPTGAVDEANPMQSSTGDSSYVDNSAITQESTADLQAELDRAYKQITLVKATAMDESTKARLLNAITVKIEVAQQELTKRQNAAPAEANPMASSTDDTMLPAEPNPMQSSTDDTMLPATGAVDIPSPTPRPLHAGIGSPAEVGAAVSDYRSRLLGRGAGDTEFTSRVVDNYERGMTEASGRAAVPTPPPRPEGGAVGDDVSLEGGSGGNISLGSGGKDTMSPAETSIREVTDAWDITPTGHIMRPDGRESPDDTFTLARKGALAGRNWLADHLFGEGVDDTDVAEATAPDDGIPDATDAYMTGGPKGYALSGSDVSQVEAAVRGWADREGIKLTTSELNARSLGLLYGFYQMRDPKKAEAIAGAYMQFKQMRYNQFSAIAKAAAGAGDTEKAVEAAVAAYSEIPDGRDFSVEGDAKSGYTVRYTNEETGKVITERVLSPNEMVGMIMNMAPGDVDKFLVKASGEDELPEASPELTKFLADLDSTPPGTRPTLDAAALAGLDSQESQIALEAMRQKMAIYDEETGGAGGRASDRDRGRLSGVAPGGGAAAPAAGTPVVAPPTSTPVAAAEGAGGSDKLAGGTESPVVETLVRGFKPGVPVTSGSNVYLPGDDQTYGVGDSASVREQVDAIMSMETAQGGTAVATIYADAEKKRVEEIGRRQNDYQMLVARTHGALPVDEPPPVGKGAEPRDDAIADPFKPEKSLYDVPGTMPVPRQTITQEEKDPTLRNAGVAPHVPPLPIIQMGRRPQKDSNVLAQIAGNDKAEALYDNDIANAQENYDNLMKVVEKEYATATELPKVKEYNGDQVSALETALSTPADPTEYGGDDAVKHIEANASTVSWVARTIDERHHLGTANAVRTARDLISVNPEKPTIPNFVAVPHPIDSTLTVVQPLDENGHWDGPKLLMPNDMYEVVLRTWEQRSEEMLSKVQPYDQTVWRGEGSRGQGGWARPRGVSMGKPEDLRPLLPGESMDTDPSGYSGTTNRPGVGGLGMGTTNNPANTRFGVDIDEVLGK